MAAARSVSGAAGDLGVAGERGAGRDPWWFYRKVLKDFRIYFSVLCEGCVAILCAQIHARAIPSRRIAIGWRRDVRDCRCAVTVDVHPTSTVRADVVQSWPSVLPIGRPGKGGDVGGWIEG